MTAEYLRGGSRPHHRQTSQDSHTWRLSLIVNVTGIMFEFLTAVNNTFMMERPGLLEINAVSMCEIFRTFQEILLSLSSGLNNLKGLGLLSRYSD